MPPLPRAQCPFCKAEVALRKDSIIREHRDRRHELYSVPGACRDGRVPVCEGSGKTVEEAVFGA